MVGNLMLIPLDWTPVETFAPMKPFMCTCFGRLNTSEKSETIPYCTVLVIDPPLPGFGPAI